MTTIFGPFNFSGTVGNNLAGADFGTGGSISSGAGTAKYANYVNQAGATDICGQFHGQKAVILDSASWGQHVYVAGLLQWAGTPNVHPSAGFNTWRLMNNAGNATVAGIVFGSAGSLAITKLGDVVADKSRNRFDFTDGQLYLLEWEVDQVAQTQSLSIYNKDGYRLEHLSGACASTATVLDRARIGVNDGVADAIVNIDIWQASTDYRETTFAAKALFYVNSLPSQSSFEVNSVAAGVPETRLSVASKGIKSASTIVAHGVPTSHVVEGLAPATRYDWTLQGNVVGVGWTDLATGSAKTGPPMSGPSTYRMGMFGCTANASTRSGAWAHALTQDLDEVWHYGDWHYYNDDVDNSAGGIPDTADLYLWDYLNQYASVVGMPALLARFGFFPTPSDHLWGNNWNTGGDQAVLNHDAAFRMLWPQYKSPLGWTGSLTDGGEQGLCYAYTTGNRIRHIIIDFRNYYRTNSDSPPSGDPTSPLRKSMGPRQMAWLLAEITNPAWRAVEVRMDPICMPNPAGHGYPTELTNKTDCYVSYWHDFLQIANALHYPNLKKPAALLTGDMHGLYSNSRTWMKAALGFDFVLLGAAATDGTRTYRNKDNAGNPIAGVYEQLFPAYNAPETTEIGVWGDVLWTDDVSSISLDFTGWDTFSTPGTPIARVELDTETWSVTSPKARNAGFPLPISASLDLVTV